MTPARAITFDVGGTLIKPWPSVGYVYARVAGEHGFPELDPSLLERRFLEAWHRKSHFDYSTASWADLVRYTFGDICSNREIDRFFPALYERFAEPAAWHLFADVRPALDRLRRRGLKLGVVSNWDERLRPLLQRLDLIDCFDSVVISVEAGFHKPAKEIFAQASSEIGIAPPEILHVGDSGREDVEGARGAGFQAVRIRREGSCGPGEIASLEDLA